MNIAMVSGPRNLSTAMMYSFAARGDCAAWDEPFYAAYLKMTGIDHPMRDEIIAAHENDPDKVAAMCRGAAPGGKAHFYQKHMTLHIIPGIDRSFMRACQNVFLIRHPARVVASYAKKREGPTLADIGFVQQAELFDEVSDWLGHAPLVIDSADILHDPPGMLRKLCAALGIAWDPAMLRWEPGIHATDGVWASHWYDAVVSSTGFGSPDKPPPELTAEERAVADACRAGYDYLAQYKIAAS